MANIDTASDVLIEALMDWGIDTIFDIPGDGINGIIEVFAQAEGEGSVHPGTP